MVAVTTRCCPRPRRPLVRILVLVTAAIALITYFRLLLPGGGGGGGGEEDEEPMDEETVMRMYLQDREGWLERKLVQYERRILPNLGLDGEPAYLEGKEKELGEKTLKTVALNVVLCDRMPLNRTLKDPRNRG